MKEEDTNKLFVKIKLGFVLIVAISFFLMPSVVSGQCSDPSETGTVKCPDSLECFSDTRYGKFYGECYYPSKSSNKADFDAGIATSVTRKLVTPEHLMNDPKLQEGLKNGKIVRDDGTVITFTPIEQLRAKYQPLPGLLTRQVQLDQAQVENRFDKVRETDGLDKAIEGYRRLMNNPLVLIGNGSTLHFEELGRKVSGKDSATEAIKLYQLNVEINPDSGRAHFKLAEAYERRLKTEPQPGDRESAIKHYELVLNSKTADQELKDAAIEKLKVLRQPT